MSSPQTLTVRQPESRLTLERFLTMRLGISRKQAKRLLDDKLVFVNRRRIWMARHELRMGDVVEVPAIKEPLRTPQRQTTLRVLFEDPTCIVIDKPAGLLSTGPNSAESQLRSLHPEILPVHRLDRETSGCLMFARTPEAQATLEKAFEDRSVGKTYQAIVIGLFPPTLTSMESLIGGLTARTEFKLLRRNATAAHIEAKPHTGRTHQIRVHLQHAGFPLAGDRSYATREVKDDFLRHLPRQMLHAWRLTWRDVETGAVKKAQAAVPTDFRDTLLALRLVSQRRR